MRQVYLIRHGETEWNVQRRIQGQSNSPLTVMGERQARQVGARLGQMGITHVIASDLGRTQQTGEIIAAACRCPLTLDARLRELSMGVLESRLLASLSPQEEQWRLSMLDGSPQGCIPQGETMAQLAERMQQALNDCLALPLGSRPVLVSHGIALGCLLSTVLGLPPYAERRLRLRNCSLSRVDYQQSAWLASGWVVETAGDVQHLAQPSMDEVLR
ncbi:2,3-diphosphoglycerate-dependent phosphoglycerate mutase GpmB [Edwardsiella anguillarum]|uniref:2,3-diphosphoglycerate-dependent phosphoglycerate mutase GpmB n=1 Tax=Edwardsiella anguillarum TaxID=1821960 RepID=UPI0024B68F2E|nr:2,3-diphosphoglycerate-dependent phosphoglycerate mutase GpmB [Edwardsiella anguillarum]WHP80808.1 2,3-diphosphoglycerate-dependent phosphoglycerate mutase GpmB [Edwardsiella anguillarum]WHQ18310.1 2,3-diphosphoglycerate-dependent phosphoglycerate mutase GpmB [Edwardsiella anguillarum]WHQ21848.1 2,3-diphosphoglycerate-dependent phosphoglycerate mutase GpmB [Edwardsiella anguillarum]WHQ25372.1 2,3-diphosphoglycerate-dependent phosphoglycerate mutase GpmB [Edwardsiella anguillarum]WHQ28895.1 